MSSEPALHKGRLRRLPPGHYQGLAWVHWTMTIKHRTTGWLDELHHARFRELLCHALARRELICAAYCLMPDHAHLLIGGLNGRSDQRLAMWDFRKVWNVLLGRGDPPVALQSQAYDHVLTDEERGREEFETICDYIFENPVRGGRVEAFPEWPFSGCLAVGYPDLDPRQEDFHERFWKIYYRLLDP